MRHLRLLMFLMLCAPGYILAVSPRKVSVIGVEQLQGADGSFDHGAVTLIIDDHSETFTYGRFSTAASVASGIAAKFSNDCTSPVYVKASGGVLSILNRSTDRTEGSIRGSSQPSPPFQQASFHFDLGSTGSIPLTSPLSLSCSPHQIVTGQATTCVASLPIGASGSPVNFEQDGVVWASTYPDPSTGAAVVDGALTTAAVGTHVITATYSDSSIGNQSAQTSVNVIGTGSAPGGTSVYAFSITNAAGNSGYDANGNVIGFSDSIVGLWSTGYDNINRMISASAVPAITGSQSNFCWAYDSFGNRIARVTSDQAITSGCTPQSGSNWGGTGTTYDTGNRIVADTPVPGTGSGQALPTVSYDAVGDIQSDNLDAPTLPKHQYLYDGDGRICAVEVQSAVGGTATIIQYVYDASGNRVAQGTSTNWSCDIDPASFTLTNEYIRGKGGEQITELGPGGTWLHTDAYAGSALVATYDPAGLHFHLSDWQGTRRVQTDYAGHVEASFQSLPFGELVQALPSNDASEQHFTGKEHDSATNLDYFGARYYNSTLGRFTSPDWSARAEPVPYAKLAEPQTLNLYAYLADDPLGSVDLDGHGFTKHRIRAWWEEFGHEDVSGSGGMAEADDGTEPYYASFMGMMMARADRLAGQLHEQAQQQTQYGKQPDGSYRADPAAVKKAIAGGKAIGSGECVALCRFLSGAPNSGTWTAGQHAAGLTDADIGTAIATFDSTGHYPSDNDPQGKNSAIFMGRGTNGSIWVVDQWPVADGPPGTHQPFLHEIRNYAPDNTEHPLRSNNADAYYVIRVP